MKKILYLLIVILVSGADAFAQCDNVFHTNTNDKQMGQKLGTKPTYINADCKMSLASNDKGIFAYIKITNSPPSKKGDQLMFMESSGTQYFYVYQYDSKELSYNNHTATLELDVKALEWLSNNTIVKVGVVSTIENKMYEYPLDATRQFEFRKILTCLVNELDRCKVGKKIVNPSSKPRYNSSASANTNKTVNPSVASNNNSSSNQKKVPTKSNTNGGSVPNNNITIPSMSLFSNTDDLLDAFGQMALSEIGNQLPKMDPQVEAFFKNTVGPNFKLSSVVNGNTATTINSFFNGSSAGVGPNIPSITNSHSGTKAKTHLPPNANPSKFNTKQELEREIVRCEGTIQNLQKKIAVNNSANNPTANSKLNHQVNMYEEEIQNYLNQIKDLEE